jgi:subtilisin family serine protease
MSRDRARMMVLTVAVVLLGSLLPTSYAQQPPEKFRIALTDGIPNRWIVVLNPQIAGPRGRLSRAPQVATELATTYGGRVRSVWTYVLNGFSIEMPQAASFALSLDPRVAYVAQDGVMRAADVQFNPPSWGLDRTDQRFLPLNNQYSYETTAGGVHVYVIDSGIRISHPDFGGRASIAGDFVVDQPTGGDDCNGHGTHVAGTIGGAAHGIAKSVNLRALRVLRCSGGGEWSYLLDAVNWVTANRIAPAVVNMSVGGDAGPWSDPVDQAIRDSIAYAGLTYVIAAGNRDVDAGTQSPARVTEAITVGATDINDVRATWDTGGRSNYGSVLDLFAAGKNIVSAWPAGVPVPVPFCSQVTSDTVSCSGTSMAAPHVAGVAALYLQFNPGASPNAVRDAIVNEATANVVGDPGPGSPNRLLYSGFITPPTPPPGGGFSVSFRASNGQWMVAEDGGGGIVNANRDNPGPWETFTLQDLNGGELWDGDSVTLQTVNGPYLQAVDGGGGAFLAIGGGPWAHETFTVVLLSGPDGRVDNDEIIALRSANGYYVVAEGGGGDIVNCNRTAIGSWEEWRIRR